jgi:amphi-Trp domain-containing protein
MANFEVEQQETISRKEAATRLRRIANLLSGDEEVTFERGGMSFEIELPEEVHFKVELEIDSDERELEIELKW